MKKLGIAVAVSALFVAGVANANEDLTTWTLVGPSTSSVAANLADLFADSTLTGNVSGIRQFQWNFISNDELPFNDIGTFALNGGVATQLSSTSDIAIQYSNAGQGQTGWQTYTFATNIYPTGFTGTLAFGVFDGGSPETGWDNPDFSSQLQIRNVSAVPEPETYAMMLAGLGLMGFVARRRKLRATTA